MESSPLGADLLGPLFLGSLLTMGLYGAGMLQAWMYWRKHKSEDPWQIRLLVIFVLLCDTAQQTMQCYAVYSYAVVDYSKGVPMMASYHRTIMSQFFPGSMLAFTVQSFYCWRIWKLIASRLVVGSIFLVVLGSLVSVLVYIVLGLQLSSLPELAVLTTLLTICVVFCVLSDILVTLGMVWGLYQRKGDIGRRSNDLVNRLIIFTFHTTIPTSLCAILDLIMVYALPGTLYYAVFYALMERLYTNCLLVTLNSRAYLRDGPRGGDLSPVQSRPSIMLSGSLFRSGTVQFAVNSKAGKSQPQRDGTTEDQTTDSGGTQDAYGSRDFDPSVV